MKRFIYTLLISLSASATSTATVVDPDAFPTGTDISNSFPGVTLSQNGNSVFSVSPISGAVASTGALVFGRTSPHWTEPNTLLRADFLVPINFVAIDVIADDSFDHGRMRVFDALDNELDIATSANLSSGGTQIERLSIMRPIADISYAIFGGFSGQTVHLDNLEFAVPEPSTFALATLGLLGIGFCRRKRA